MSSGQQDRVNTFNRLRRPQFDDRGHPNHYHFCVQSLPVVPGDAVVLVNPYNGHYHTEGRTNILSLPLAQRAKVIVPLLLYSFNGRFDESESIPQMSENNTPWAPWSWSTDNPALSEAVSARLRAIGARQELCQVSVSERSMIEVGERKWGAMEQEMERMMPFFPGDQFRDEVDQSCNYCGFTPSLDYSFQRCARCKRAYYCSRECQKVDWSSHKKSCAPPTC